MARIIHHKPAQKLKICSQTLPLKTDIGAVSGRGIVQTSVQALGSLFESVQRKRDDLEQVTGSTWVRIIYHQPAQKLKNRPDRDPPGAIIGAVDGQRILQTSVQALHTLRGYVQRK